MANTERNKTLYNVCLKLGQASAVLVCLAGPFAGVVSRIRGTRSDLTPAIYVLAASGLCAIVAGSIHVHLTECGLKPSKDPLKLCIPILILALGGPLAWLFLGSFLKGMLPGNG